MSCNGNPARKTIALPSPVQAWAGSRRRNKHGHNRPLPDRHTRAEAMQRAVIHLEAITPRQRPSSSIMRSSAKYSMKNSVFQRAAPDHKAYAKSRDRCGQRQQHGALRRALAVIGCHAAEWTLIDLAFFGARKRHAPCSNSYTASGAFLQRYSIASRSPSHIASP